VIPGQLARSPGGISPSDRVAAPRRERGQPTPGPGPPDPEVALPLAVLARRHDLAHPLGPGRRPDHPLLAHPGGQNGPRRSRRSCRPPSVVPELVAALGPVALHPSSPLTGSSAAPSRL